MLTLEKFEEASEVVKQVTTPTKLVYSEYLSAQTFDSDKAGVQRISECSDRGQNLSEAGKYAAYGSV